MCCCCVASTWKDMVSETEVRRSGRRTVRPVEFWNFEKPDESRSETIIYNLNDLSKCSIYNVMSTKYIHGNKSVPVENKKTETTRSLKKRATVQDGQERQSRTLQATSNNANSNKHKTKSKKIVGKNDMTKATENKDVSVISKVSKSSKEINETEVPQEHPPKLMIKKHNEQENGSSVMSTIKSDTVSIRRSGRVRTKPLEFWNFEKIEVRALENGEVDVIHHKQELPVIRKKKDKESQTSQHPAVNSNRHKACVRKSPQRLFTESSVSKRKLFSPISNSLDETANAEDSKPLKRMRRSLETKEESPVPPTIKVTQFKDLNFIETVSKRCRCYLARCFQDEEFDTYAGFAFVEWGQLVWVTTRETKLFVIEGLGTLKMTDATAKGKIVYLETRTEVAITSGKKVSVVKDGKCKMLKLFIYLGSTTTTSSSSNMMSVPIQRCS